MIEFEKKIVHILDCEHNTCILSSACTDDDCEETLKILSSKAEKVFHSSAKKLASFQMESGFLKLLEDYKQGLLSFEDLSSKLANHIFEKKMEYAQYRMCDLVIALVKKEDRKYLFLLDNACVSGMTHVVSQENGNVKADIIPYRTLISSQLTKNDSAVLIELSDYSIQCVENKVEIEGEKVNFYATIILQSQSNLSYKESVKSMSKLTKELQDKYDLDMVQTMPKMKSLLVDNVDQSKPIEIDEIADELFVDQPLIKEEFKAELKKQGVPQKIDVEYVKPTKMDRVQKIKTDKGIEIIIPVDYMDTKDVVEFITNPDGTISIELKNILHITSK